MSTTNPEVQKVVVSEINPRAGGDKLIAHPQEIIRSVRVQLSVLLGSAEISVGALLEMKSGEVLSVNRRVDEPLDLVIEGKVVARGELVVVENNLGLRITEIAPR